MNKYNFGPASPEDDLVFGGAAPSPSLWNVRPADVGNWLEFVRGEGIQRVVCLLNSDQLSKFDSTDGGLLERLEQSFGDENVASSPIRDFQLIDRSSLEAVLSFLDTSVQCKMKALVFCLAGIGRTGHVLAAWLAHSRGLNPAAAIQEVRVAGVERDAREAVGHGVTTEMLYSLLKFAQGQDE